VFRPPTPLGQRPPGTVHHRIGPVNPVSELARGTGLLAARTDLHRNSGSARWLLSILTSVGHSSASEKLAITSAPSFDETGKSVREDRRQLARQRTSQPPSSQSAIQ